MKPVHKFKFCLIACCFFVCFLRSTFVGSVWSLVFFITATTPNDLRLRRIAIPDLIHYIIFLSYFLRKSQYFPFQCSVLNKRTTGSIFITSLVWRGPWLGIEPGTSSTRCQHSTTRLSRRRSEHLLMFNNYMPSKHVMNIFIKHILNMVK